MFKTMVLKQHKTYPRHQSKTMVCFCTFFVHVIISTYDMTEKASMYTSDHKTMDSAISLRTKIVSELMRGLIPV